MKLNISLFSERRNFLSKFNYPWILITIRGFITSWLFLIFYGNFFYIIYFCFYPQTLKDRTISLDLRSQKISCKNKQRNLPLRNTFFKNTTLTLWHTTFTLQEYCPLRLRYCISSVVAVIYFLNLCYYKSYFLLNFETYFKSEIILEISFFHDWGHHFLNAVFGITAITIRSVTEFLLGQRPYDYEEANHILISRDYFYLFLLSNGTL